MRSSDTIKRLKMYNNGKAIRNKEGTIVGGQFMMRDRAGDTEITAGEFSFNCSSCVRKCYIATVPIFLTTLLVFISFENQQLEESSQTEDGLEILE